MLSLALTNDVLASPRRLSVPLPETLIEPLPKAFALAPASVPALMVVLPL